MNEQDKQLKEAIALMAITENKSIQEIDKKEAEDLLLRVGPEEVNQKLTELTNAFTLQKSAIQLEQEVDFSRIEDKLFKMQEEENHLIGDSALKQTDESHYKIK